MSVKSMVIYLLSIIFFIFREQKPNHGGYHISWSQRGSYLALGTEYLHHVSSTYLVSLSSSDRAGLWEKLELDMQVRLTINNRNKNKQSICQHSTMITFSTSRPNCSGCSGADFDCRFGSHRDL